MNQIQPLGARVLINNDPLEEKRGSLFIPQTSQEKSQYGTVVAVGDDETIKVKEGDRVMYDKYSVITTLDDQVIVNYDSIVAVVRPY